MGALSRQEIKSVTHGDFWIPEPERELYKKALGALNARGVPYVIAGAYAIYAHTGIYRETKDLDVFVEPANVVPAMRALKAIGLTTRLEQAHWLAKAKEEKHFVDILAQVQMFNYVYPEYKGVPHWVSEELLRRAHEDLRRERTEERVTRGTLVSRFSFTIDINEWQFRDVRAENVRRTEQLPIIREIVASDVWDERSRAVEEYNARVA
jgi:hypothetical protein